MRFAGYALAAGAALAALLLSPSASVGGQTNLGVTAREWTLTLSQPRVDPGRAEIQYVNAGEDPHDLKIRKRGSRRVRSIAELGPGGIDELDLRLRRGSRYVMWCSTLDGQHRGAGMQAELKVKRRR